MFSSPMVAVVAACAVLVMVPPDVDELLLVEGSLESGANVSRERSNPAAIAASSLSMSRATAS